MKAIWKNQVIAESDDTINIEGNEYFPADCIKQDVLLDSETHSVCPWKGTASYYSIQVGKEVNKDAAWYYPQASELAKSIEGRIAFWKGVEITH